jgi:hypothetical protein
MVPLPIIGLALEFGDLALFIVDVPLELPIPVVAFVPLVETDGLFLLAVVPMPLGEVLAVDPVPQGCGLWPSVLLLLRPVPVVVPPGDIPAPPAPMLPEGPAAAPALPDVPPPPPVCAKAAVLPAARNAAVRIARV